MGIAINAASVAFLVVWGLPAVAVLEDGDAYADDIAAEIPFAVLEIVATIIGLVLIFRRWRNVRRYWVVYLSLFCLVQLWEVFVALEPGDPFFFLIAGLVWLAYWAWATRPRQLPLEGFWAHQGSPRNPNL
jgi:L-lactate permease